jgi:hypothetical protein
MKGWIVAAALMLSGVAAADVVPPPVPVEAGKPMSLNALVFAQYGGGWVSVTTSPNGATLSASLILKEDLTYENGASGSGPGASGPSLSAIGQGFWFARVAADGTVEIALTRDQTDPNPTWIVKPLSDGTMSDGSGVWTRGK